VNPFARSRSTRLRYLQRLFEVTFHYRCLPLHSASNRPALDLASGLVAIVARPASPGEGLDHRY
jgi:hypothetical protein